MGLLILVTTLAMAQVPTSSAAADPLFEHEERAPEIYRNPTGSIVFGGIVGAAVGNRGTAFVLGASFGYAVVTGVVPGIRGVAVAGDGFGGELAATLLLTPPLDWPVLPFVVGEGGHRWDRDFSGFIYGGGGGLFIGSPRSRVGLQVGWIVRRFAIHDGPTVDASGPLIGVSASF